MRLTKSSHKTHHARYALHMPGKRFRYAVVLVAVAVVGLLVMQSLRAASFSLDAEAETGTVAGSAVITAVNGASGGQAVSFGANNTVLSPPHSVKAITGGDTIAIVWRMPLQTVKSVEVYRDNVRVGVVSPNSGVVRAERLGIRYIDRAVTSGTTYQYKLRAISPADTASAFTPTVSARHPVSTTPKPTVTIDSSQASDLAAYTTNTLKSELEIWYPKISDAIAYPDYVPANSIHLFLDPANTGVAGANAGQRRISINPAWLRANPAEGGGMIIHEATHILQNYPSANPGWVTEGVADWTRDWLTQERMHIPSPSANLADAYSEGALALQWSEAKYSPGLIRKTNVAMHRGTFSNGFFTNLTGGRSAEQLYAEAKQQHYGSTGAIRGVNSLCIDIPNSNPEVGTRPQLFGCNNTNAQKWTVVYHDAGLHGSAKSVMSFINSAILAEGRCLDVASSGTANGTLVHSWSCNYGNAQKWQRGANNSLVNPNSGRCLSTAGGASGTGAQLVIANCDGSPTQSWNLP